MSGFEKIVIGGGGPKEVEVIDLEQGKKSCKDLAPLPISGKNVSYF